MKRPWRLMTLALAMPGLILAGGAGAQDMASRFARPASGAAAQALVAEEARAIALARRTVADMRRIARTPQEQALAAQDGQIVERVARLLTTRAALRSQMALAVTPPSVSGTGRASPPLPGAISMQETQMNFSLQYRQLQSQMQQEDRSFTMVSNIMKTRHDTVKNAISNVR